MRRCWETTSCFQACESPAIHWRTSLATASCAASCSGVRCNIASNVLVGGRSVSRGALLDGILLRGVMAGMGEATRRVLSAGFSTRCWNRHVQNAMQVQYALVSKVVRPKRHRFIVSSAAEKPASSSSQRDCAITAPISLRPFAVFALVFGFMLSCHLFICLFIPLSCLVILPQAGGSAVALPLCPCFSLSSP